jgi:hypothetical protein
MPRKRAIRGAIPLDRTQPLFLTVASPAGVILMVAQSSSNTMLILRGLSAPYAKRGLLDDESALAYAQRLGYTGEVLDIAGEGPQVQMALDRIRGGDVIALYGFSRGGYNMRTIWNQLTPEQRSRFQKIVIVGAPGVTAANFPGISDVVVQGDPPEGHMAGPKVLLLAARTE